MAPRTSEQLLRDVAKLQDEVARLRKQHNEKEAELTSLKAKKNLSSISNLAQQQEQEHRASDGNGASLKDYGIEDTDSSEILLAGSAALAADEDSWQLESLYRMAGITTFAVKDPGPDRTDLLGVRIEIFVDRTFKMPYYIILAPYDRASSKASSASSSASENPFSTPSSLKELSKIHAISHKHTLPSFFIPYYDSLCEKHLPPPPAPQSLLHVAVGIRRALTLYHTRLCYMEEIEKRICSSPRIENAEGVWVSGFKVDAEAKLVVVEWTKDGDESEEDDNDEDMDETGEEARAAWIAVTDEGEIGTVVVKEKKRRVRAMERQILGDTGRKKTLAQVLGEEDKYTMPIRKLVDRLVWNDEPSNTAGD